MNTGILGLLVAALLAFFLGLFSFTDTSQAPYDPELPVVTAATMTSPVEQPA